MRLKRRLLEYRQHQDDPHNREVQAIAAPVLMLTYAGLFVLRFLAATVLPRS